MRYISLMHPTGLAIASRFLSSRDRTVQASVIANTPQLQTKKIAISTSYRPKCDRIISKRERINLSQRVMKESYQAKIDLLAISNKQIKQWKQLK